MKQIHGWVVAVTFAVAGVAGAQQPQGFDPALFQKQMEAMQKALQANAKAAQPVVDFRVLKTLLPEAIGGLKRTGAKGEKNSAMGMTVAKAEGTYADDKAARLTVEITDMAGVGALGALAQMGMVGAEIDNESDDGYERTIKVKDFKGVEKYTTKSKSGEVNLLVGRFAVKIDGRGIAPTVLKTAIDAIDLQRLSSLKASAE